MCFVSVCCVGFAHFGCLPDETCSNGSPVFAGYFLPPIWKKMGSEDRWQRTLIDGCYLSSDLTEWRVFGLILGKLLRIHFMYLSDCNWILLVFLVRWPLCPRIDTQSPFQFSRHRPITLSTDVLWIITDFVYLGGPIIRITMCICRIYSDDIEFCSFCSAVNLSITSSVDSAVSFCKKTVLFSEVESLHFLP